MPKSMILYEREIATLLDLPEEQRNHIFTALLCTSLDREPPALDAMETAVFSLISAQVARAAELSEKRRKSAKSRWENKQDSTSVMQGDTNVIQNDTNSYNADTNLYTITTTPTVTSTKTETVTKHPPKSPRGDSAAKSKPAKEKFAEFVSMTNDEYTSLVAKVGEQGAKRCIEILDNYKGSSGKKYSSDYRAILNWVIGRYEEELAKKRPANAGNARQPPQSSGNPFLEMLKEIEESEGNTVDAYGNVTGNGNS